MPSNPFAEVDDSRLPSALKQRAVDERQQAKDDAKMLIEAAGVCFQQRQFEEGEELLLQALKLRETANGPEHRKLVPILICLGVTYAEAGRFDESERAFRRGLTILQKNPRGADKFREIELLEHYTQMLHRSGRASEASQMDAHLRLLRSENILLSGIARHVTPSISVTALKFMEIVGDSKQKRFAVNPLVVLLVVLCLILVGLLVILLR